MKAEMTSRERMLAAIDRERSDRVPLSPYLPQGPWLGEPLFWRDQIERARRLLELELDPTVDIWMPDAQPHADVRIKTWREKKGNEIFITKEYHTPAGVLRQVVRETNDWCGARHGPMVPTIWGTEKREHFGVDLLDDYNVSRRIEPWVKGRDDLEKLRYVTCLPEGHALDEWRMDAERAMEFAKKLKVLTVARRTIVGDAFQWFCDIPWFMTQLYDDPEFVRQFLAIFQDWSMKLVNLVLEVGVDVVQYRGWYEIPTFWGPRFWGKCILPYIEQQAEQVHSAGKRCSYLLPEGQGAYAEALKDTNIDILQGVDPRMLHGGDLGSLFGKLGQSKSFWGGVNAEVTLAGDDYEKIEQEVKQAINSLGLNNGLILSAFIFPETPLQRILCMIEAWKKHRTIC